jgi:hypothetical protein
MRDLAVREGEVRNAPDQQVSLTVGKRLRQPRAEADTGRLTALDEASVRLNQSDIVNLRKSMPE